jgi:AmmeMemoRadiSam system protein B
MNPRVRPSAIAGRWYPGNGDVLRSSIERYFAETPPTSLTGPILGLVVPHAGYAYSGPTAGRGFAQVRHAGFTRVVLLGPLHRPIWGSALGSFMVPIETAYQTPLGNVPLDQQFIEKLGQRVVLTRVQGDEEHSLEIELPFLQVALGQFALVPIMLGESVSATAISGAAAIKATQRVSELAAALAAVIAESPSQKTLLVCSTDLSHMDDYADVVRTDRALVDMVGAFDVAGLRLALETGAVQACGGAGLLAILESCVHLGARGTTILHYTNSGEITGDKRPGSYTVGYLAAAIYG